jgi:coenzyme F420-dependent glucose-6-phosphate dehydrogenase
LIRRRCSTSSHLSDTFRPRTKCLRPGSLGRNSRSASLACVNPSRWFGHSGRRSGSEKATIYDRPDTPVPIYVAAAGALVARYAGRSAEGFICTSGKKPEPYTETLLPKVAEGIAASEDPSRSYDRMIEVKVSFDTDKVRALTRHWAALALTPEEKMTVEDPVEMQRLADALPLDRAASQWIVSSDADEHVERIGYYVGLGFRNLVFHAPGPDQARFLKLYGEQVLPRLRKHFG